MTGRNFQIFLLFMSYTLVLCASNAKKPNILLILADDYGYNDVGYHGSEIKTPILDKLAAEGVKLENYYVQPICTPSRSQLLSGRYQIHTGLQHSVIQPPVPNGLPLELPTLADMLKKQGYSTHIIGKWHLGFYKKEYMPTNRGFDSHYGYLTGAEDYYKHTRSMPYEVHGKKKEVNGLDFRHNMDLIRDQNGSYSAMVFASRAAELVRKHAENNRKQPLFLYLPFQSVHAPLQVPKHYEDKYSFIKDRHRRSFAGMVSCMDEAIGNITQAYKDAGLWDNTVLVFSTDNGGQVLEGGNNWPLRGWKDQLWEGGVKGVGFVNSPLLEKKGTINHELIHVSDWYPTLLGLGKGSTEGLKLDGYDQWKTVSTGMKTQRKELLHNIDPLTDFKGVRWTNSSFDNRVRAAIRVGDWKLLTGDPGIGKWIPPPHIAEVNSSLSRPDNDPSDKNLWLFNLADDPLEKNDLSSQYPVIVQTLLDRLAAYNTTAVPCRFPPFDPESNPDFHGGVWGPWR